MTAGSTWWPVTADYVTARDVNDWLHAVDQGSTKRRDRRYRRVVLNQTRPERWIVACGARVLHVVAAQELSPTGETTGAVVLAWPPPAKSTEGERCRDCWEATGRKRQAEQWRDLIEAPAPTEENRPA